MTAFFDVFERHAAGEGLKGHSTHYCPGCGHGLLHKYLSEAITELGIQDRTVLISPVGCAVFAYYYFDVGNSQAAHGRAPAVGLGHKTANPDSIVVCYQGDGDLASIGLAEIMQAAQLGLPISVIFVNNGVYGMTGGQMAPTTLRGQQTTTSPEGRGRLMGEPLKVAELMASLDGPIYVERVALFDAKQRNRARKAILKALRLQVEGRGFAFVEALAECPTHLKLTPLEAEAWVRDHMEPVFPLGVKKDLEVEPWFTLPAPSFDPEIVRTEIGGVLRPVPRFGATFPHHVADGDVALKLAGAGGDGAQTAAMLLTRAAINEGFDATHIPSYGPESRGGTSYADVRLAEGEVLSPAAPHPHLLVAFNAPSLAKFGPEVRPGGLVLFDSAVVEVAPPLGPDVRVVGLPLSTLAAGLGNPRVKNIVALGALNTLAGLLPAESLLAAIEQALDEKCALIPINQRAFAAGVEAASTAGAAPVARE